MPTIRYVAVFACCSNPGVQFDEGIALQVPPPPQISFTVRES
jgi:hypothetical protein